jgi:large subunit ribosomal protein L24
MAAKIKTNDKVVVLAGKDKGKTGKVLTLRPSENRAIVEGVNIVTRHVRPSQLKEGGINRKESPIHLSNLAIADPKDGKPTRIGFRIEKDGTKVRVAKRSGEVIDV